MVVAVATLSVTAVAAAAVPRSLFVPPHTVANSITERSNSHNKRSLVSSSSTTTTNGYYWNQLRGGAAASASVTSSVKTATTTAASATASATSSTALLALKKTTTSSATTTATATSKLERIDYDAANTDAGSLTIPQLAQKLQLDQTSVIIKKAGLSVDQVAARQAQYGPNELKAKPTTSIWQLIAEQFQDRLVQILLGVAVLSAVFSVLQQQGNASGNSAISSNLDQVESLWQAMVEPAVILAILVLNAATGVWQSMSADDSLASLQKLQAQYCRVYRGNGVLQEVAAVDLVPGDVLVVSVGDKIAADARLVSLEQSLSLQVDQGSLTGESVTVGKLAGEEGTVAADSPVQDQKGMLFAGTMVTAGRGKAIVVQTGMDTQFGKIQAGVTEAAATQVKTPLAIKLDDFGETLTVIIGVICLAVWIVSIPKMNDPSFDNVWQGGIYYAKVAVALGVAAIPEGLPAVITLCLSLGTRRMAERNVIVRKLPSVETLGCVTTICTDKTGTLTQNGTCKSVCKCKGVSCFPLPLPTHMPVKVPNIPFCLSVSLFRNDRCHSRHDGARQQGGGQDSRRSGDCKGAPCGRIVLFTHWKGERYSV